MTLKERLVEDMKVAMKAKEEGKVRLSVIRMARAAIKNAEIDKRIELNDDQVIEVLAREMKMRRDSLEACENANRPEMVEALKKEITILTEYLPGQLSEGEIRQLVQEAIALVGAQGPKDLGKVMGTLTPNTLKLKNLSKTWAASTVSSWMVWRRPVPFPRGHVILGSLKGMISQTIQNNDVIEKPVYVAIVISEPFTAFISLPYRYPAMDPKMIAKIMATQI